MAKNSNKTSNQKTNVQKNAATTTLRMMYDVPELGLLQGVEYELTDEQVEFVGDRGISPVILAENEAKAIEGARVATLKRRARREEVLAKGREAKEDVRRKLSKSLNRKAG